MFKKVGIIGIGLIGGSICIDIKRKGVAERVIGYSRRIETIEKAIKKKIIDEYSEKVEEVIKNVDFLILSTPIGALEEYFKIIKKVNPEVFFTDVSSVKKIVCDRVKKIIGKRAKFVGSHPIAGSEKSGIEFAKEGLFENKVIIITPTKNTERILKERVKDFWERLGGKVIEMSPEKHDRILGFTSHLPHFLIFVLLSLAKKNKISKDFYGSGFMDTTRIGKSNPEMWTDIFFSNKKNILKYLDMFEKELRVLKNLLKEDKIYKLREILEKGKSYREKIE